MKIKTAKLSYERVLALPPGPPLRPKRPNLFFRTLLKAVSVPDLYATHFQCKPIHMERLGKDEPCIYLMNHSSFIDLKIAASLLYPRPFNIVCTSDGFVGKARLMQNLGCIPAKKFISDLPLILNIRYALKTLHNSVLMYPEASYSFDGTATPLPESLGSFLKLLGVPVVMIRTRGAFSRDPLYNNLQRRRVNVSAEMEYLLSPEQIKAATAQELNDALKKQFSFDYFLWQREQGVRITEPFRADCLNRVLYKCPHCLQENRMEGKGITLGCQACGKTYELTELGALRALEGEAAFDHIPDWYRWQRDCVRQEIRAGAYLLDIPVDIRMMVNMDCIYEVGAGRLRHDRSGFHLTGCDGKLDYRQSPQASYSLYSDYYWYEIGDMICIGNKDALYYCFPQNGEDVAAKTRLAVEELYKRPEGSPIRP